MRRSTTACLLLVVLLAFAGCGGGGANEKRFSGDSKDVAAVVDRLQDSARQGDSGVICDELLTKELTAFISKSYGKACSARVAEQLTKQTTITVDRLQVQGPLASATVKEQNGHITGLAFIKRDGEWRISRIQG
jgi:hypothetical protein